MRKQRWREKDTFQGSGVREDKEERERARERDRETEKERARTREGEREGDCVPQLIRKKNNTCELAMATWCCEHIEHADRKACE